jgi:hypothetical protein
MDGETVGASLLGKQFAEAIEAFWIDSERFED